MEYFSKPLFLPSNGLEYDKTCYINPPTLEFFLFYNDNFFNDSELEKQISFLKKYTGIDPLELYTFDFYYILATYYVYLQAETVYHKPAQCIACSSIFRLETDLAKLPQIKILPSGTDKFLKTRFDIKEHFDVTYRRRKVIDNLEFSQLTMDKDKFPDAISRVIAFVLPQIDKIERSDGTIISRKNDIEKFLIFQKARTVYNVYEKLTEKDFGLDDRVVYKCPECGFKNHTSLYDDIEMSVYYDRRQDNRDAFEYLKHMIDLNRFNFMNYGDIKNIPIYYFATLNEAVTKLGTTHIVPSIL